MERTNTQRAERAEQAVLTYDGEDREYSRDDVDLAHQVIKDLLTDLQHLADRVGVDWVAAVHASGRMYEEELRDDPAGDWQRVEVPS